MKILCWLGFHTYKEHDNLVKLFRTCCQCDKIQMKVIGGWHDLPKNVVLPKSEDI